VGGSPWFSRIRDHIQEDTMSERQRYTGADLRHAAVSFLEMVASGRVDDAYSYFVGPGFRHHNPYFRGDADSLRAAMAENAQSNPGRMLEVEQTLQEGQLVAVHSRVRINPGDRGSAVVHIFRFEEGLIVELWDVGQEVPEESPNVHGMF
jgi:predicted SnoaL-like aldol condensation-catalyzing enzyme